MWCLNCSVLYFFVIVSSHVIMVGECISFMYLLPYLLCPMQFVEKAPEDIVRGVREKAVETEEKITLTKNRLALLESTALVT